MDIRNYVHRFQALETRHGFFNAKNRRGIKFWDLARYHVYQAIYFKLDHVEDFSTSRNPLPDRIRLAFHNIRQYISFRFSVVPARLTDKHLFFTYSRYRWRDDVNTDYVSANIVEALLDASVLFENFTSERTRFRYRAKINSYPAIVQYLYSVVRRFSTPPAEYHPIANILQEEFGVELPLAAIIREHTWKFEMELTHYLRLFRRYRPRSVFVVMTGGEKAICAAAHRLEIPVIEIQHCLVNYYQPFYSYPAIPETTRLLTNPDYILTFSPFWNSVQSCPLNAEDVGNDYYADAVPGVVAEFSLLIISAVIYNDDLCDVLDKLLADGFEKPVALKLHPNQALEANLIRSKYEKWRNVTVVSNETALGELIQRSETIFSIQSTGVYQALNCGRKVVLLKAKNYQVHEDIFFEPDVYLVSTPAELMASLDEPVSGQPSSRYFDRFDPLKLRRFLDKHNMS